MKEIRFRAYVEDKMHRVVGLDLWCDSTADHTFTIWDDNFLDVVELRIADYKLMRYSGHRDINDKEIYEGDIVHLKNKYSSYIESVVFEEGCFSFEDETLYRSLKIWEGEVIGNIYENPELLQPKNQPEEDR